ncbi:MAG: histidine kinase [Undibacterium sp.]|nr:histidine kinase [Undibacterium sp.]
MNPLFSNAKSFLALSFFCVLLTILMSGVMLAGHLGSWTNALGFSLPLSFLMGFSSSSAYYVCRALPLAERHFFKVCLSYTIASLGYALALTTIAYAWNSFSLSLAVPELGLTFSEPFALGLALTAAFFYLIALLAFDVLMAFSKLRLAERREAQAEIQTREAQLQVLRTQINPHFLFNSLNSISALTAIDASAARQMTIELAQFFRQTLALAEKKSILLSEEITLCQHYLAVEKIRFGKKLLSTVELDPKAMDSLIPPLLLQPLFENAIKHGIRDLSEGGTISLQVEEKEGWLFIRLTNPIDTEATPTIGTGTGLKNCSARLASLYPERSRVEWQIREQLFSIELAFTSQKN